MNKVKKLLQKILHASHFAEAKHAFTKTSISFGIIKLEQWGKAHAREEEQLHLVHT